MKKITFLLSFIGLAMFSSAQTKITFEDQTLNGAATLYSGTATVVANPVKTGINTSSYCLDVVNNGYAPVKFTNFTVPSGAKTAYQYVTLKFKIAYKGINGSAASDVNYPAVDVFSSPTSPVLDATEKLGSIGNVWSTPITTPSTDSLVWKSAQFTMSASVLANIPSGMLVLKLAKNRCEYLIDDVELVPSPIYGTNILSLYDFESDALSTAYTAANVYGGTVACTSVVVADPKLTPTKSLQVSPTSYNQVASFNVTLPGGRLLTEYDRLYFDSYVTAATYAQTWVAANSTIIYKDASGYPSVGTAATWVTKDYELASMPASNNFTLYIGYYSMNSGSYYLDNIKLNLKATGGTTALNQKQVNPLVVSCDGSALRLNMTVDKIEMFDMSGRSVITRNNVKELNVSMLNNGVYIVKSSLAGESYTTKVLK